MSQRGASSLAQFRTSLTVIVVTALVPVIIPFFLYFIATAAGATSAPVVGYGISACAGAGCVANGVSSIWLPAGPSEPTIVLSVLNDFLLFVVILVVGVEAVHVVGGRLTTQQD